MQGGKFQDIHDADDIVIKIFEGFLHAFANHDVRGKVQNAFKLVGRKQRLQVAAIQQVAHNQGGLWVHSLAVACAQVVEHNNFVAALYQHAYDMAADVTRAAGNEYFHG